MPEKKNEPIVRKPAISTVTRAPRPEEHGITRVPAIEYLRELNGDPSANRVDNQAVRNLAKRYVEWVTAKREPVLPPQAAQAQQYVMDKLHPTARQDAELQVLKEQQEAARQQLAPRDEGEIDSPQGSRPPIQMQREFSNDTEKEAYLERIRQAQRNASK